MEDSSPLEGNPGDPVPEVNPNDLKTFWREIHRSRARSSGQPVTFSLDYVESMCEPGTDGRTVYLRTNMILILQMTAPERLAPWTKGEEVDDAVFRTMAPIP